MSVGTGRHGEGQRMTAKRTKEPQFDYHVALRDEEGLETFGLMSNQTWRDDPKRLAFLLSRYKFVAKMLEGKKSAIEIGCADAFGTRIVRQVVPRVVATDFDPLFIEDAKQHASSKWPIEFAVHDILEGPVKGGFEAAFSLDVIEHIPAANERQFMRNVAASLTPDGVAIIGTPSLESQAYASPASKIGHVNCKTAAALKALAGEHFVNVFLFSMNDEVVHTGFYPMAHYLLALCCGTRATAPEP